MNNSTTQEAVFAARSSNPRWDPVAAANRLPEGWAEFLALFWACVSALQEGKRGAAYDKLVAALQPFIKVSVQEVSRPWAAHVAEALQEPRTRPSYRCFARTPKTGWHPSCIAWCTT